MLTMQKHFFHALPLCPKKNKKRTKKKISCSEAARLTGLSLILPPCTSTGGGRKEKRKTAVRAPPGPRGRCFCLLVPAPSPSPSQPPLTRPVFRLGHHLVTGAKFQTQVHLTPEIPSRSFKGLSWTLCSVHSPLLGIFPFSRHLLPLSPQPCSPRGSPSLWMVPLSTRQTEPETWAASWLPPAPSWSVTTSSQSFS